MSELSVEGFQFIAESLVSLCANFDAAIDSLVDTRQGTSGAASEFGRGVARGAGHKLGMLGVGAVLSLLLE